MRVLGVLAAWGVLAVLATMCFALGGSLGYRRGVKDTLTQIRERRTGMAGCRPLPANHLRRRTSGHARPGHRARRARWRPRHAGAPVAGPTRAVVPVRSDPRVIALSATVAAILLIGVPATAIGATTAQPGESLYTMRRNLERVRVALATGPEDDTEVHVELAAARLTDLEGLVGHDIGPDVIADVSSNLGAHATAASDRLTRVEDDTHRTALGLKLRHVVGRQVEVMDDIVTLDCGGDAARDCEALSATRDGSVALRLSTERDVAVAEGAPAPPPRSATQADKGGVVAKEVGEPATDDAGAATGAGVQEAEEPGKDDPGTGDDDPAATPAAAAASTAAPRDSTSAPPSKPSTSATPTSAPSPSSSETPSSSPAPTAPAAGSPATEPDAAAGGGGDAGGRAGAATDDAGQ